MKSQHPCFTLIKWLSERGNVAIETVDGLYEMDYSEFKKNLKST